ncbi:MAG: cell division protein SepF [Firmicutes bacterium]|nr:cell division protein SepF [Bacillota bacterium]
MANFVDKFKNIMMGNRDMDNDDIIGDEDEYDDRDRNNRYYDEDDDDEVNETKFRSSKVTSIDKHPSRISTYQSAKVMSINTKMEVVISNPKTLEEASSVCEDLMAKKTTVVNLENVERDMAQRISDFLSGACYALNGSIKLISERIFIIGPVNVDITNEFKDELKASGIKFSAAVWK